MPFCTACGKQNDNDSAFCMYCGAKLLNAPPAEQDVNKQKYNELLIKSYEEVKEKYGGNYQDWYYVNLVRFTPKGRGSIKGTTMPVTSDSSLSSGGLLRIHKTYIEYVEINNWSSLFLKKITKNIVLPTFNDITNSHRTFIPFKNILYNRGSRIFLHNGQYIALVEIELLCSKPKIILEKPSFLKGQNNFEDSLFKSYENYLNQENNFSKADEIKKFKELLDEGVITEDEFVAFKKKLL